VFLPLQTTYQVEIKLHDLKRQQAHKKVEQTKAQVGLRRVNGTDRNQKFRRVRPPAHIAQAGCGRFLSTGVLKGLRFAVGSKFGFQEFFRFKNCRKTLLRFS